MFYGIFQLIYLSSLTQILMEIKKITYIVIRYGFGKFEKNIFYLFFLEFQDSLPNYCRGFKLFLFFSYVK
jgi:hypothetical protein